MSRAHRNFTAINNFIKYLSRPYRLRLATSILVKPRQNIETCHIFRSCRPMMVFVCTFDVSHVVRAYESIYLCICIFSTTTSTKAVETHMLGFTGARAAQRVLIFWATTLIHVLSHIRCECFGCWLAVRAPVKWAQANQICTHWTEKWRGEVDAFVARRQHTLSATTGLKVENNLRMNIERSRHRIAIGMTTIYSRKKDAISLEWRKFVEMQTTNTQFFDLRFCAEPFSKLRHKMNLVWKR